MTTKSILRSAAASLVLAFVLALAIAPLITAQTGVGSIYGRWKIVRMIPTTDIQVSTDDVKKYLDLEIVYSEDQFKCGEQTLEHPKYKTARLRSAIFYDQYRAQLKELGITRGSVATIEVLDVHGDRVVNPGAIVFLKNSNTIVTIWDGVYLDALRERLPNPLKPWQMTGLTTFDFRCNTPRLNLLTEHEGFVNSFD
jgi:hypothetical protein